MVNFGGFGTDLETEFRALHCVPRPRSHLEKSSPTTLNITWYLVWQVVFPVYWFAQTLVADDFSLEQLCKVVKVDLKKLAEFAVQRGIESVDDLELKRYLRPNVSSANRRRRTASVGPSRLTKALKETSKGTKKRSTVYSDKYPPVATIPEPAHPTEPISHESKKEADPCRAVLPNHPTRPLVLPLNEVIANHSCSTVCWRQ